MKRNRVIEFFRDCEALCREQGVGFMSIGTAIEPRHVAVVPDIIAATTAISTSATVSDRRTGISEAMLHQSARTIHRIARVTPHGYGNFRFAAIANCPSDIPFYPAGYHTGKRCFTIALEASDLLVEVFTRARNIIDAKKKLFILLETKYKNVERAAHIISKKCGILFRGIDTSPAPSTLARESIVRAFEKRTTGIFGSPGTLAVAGAITEVLKKLRVKSWGYCGLMLPVLEDVGLAQRWSEGCINLDTMLLYSSVCGTGLDCIPLPGKTPVSVIRRILTDMATIAVRFDKPLSARLFPVPNGNAGDFVTFHSPYLVDCRLQEVVKLTL